MVSSFVISVVWFVMRKNGCAQPFAHTVLYSVAFTTLSWILAACFGPPTSRDRLIAFWRKVHPAGPGWTRIRIEAGDAKSAAEQHSDHMGWATVGWVSGCFVIWSSLFAIGNYLYGRRQNAIVLTVVFVTSGVVLLRVISRLWKS